jgi:deazaflavin-dependent oxidoreductase (nitroreductase family)
MSEPSSWPADFQKAPRLDLATVGRKTGKIHKVKINFATMGDRIFVVSMNESRDWAKNLLKNPEAEATIKDTTRKVRAARIDPEAAHIDVETLYKKKFHIGARLYYHWQNKNDTTIFELIPYDGA